MEDGACGRREGSAWSHPSLRWERKPVGWGALGSTPRHSQRSPGIPHGDLHGWLLPPRQTLARRSQLTFAVSLSQSVAVSGEQDQGQRRPEPVSRPHPPSPSPPRTLARLSLSPFAAGTLTTHLPPTRKLIGCFPLFRSTLEGFVGPFYNQPPRCFSWLA